MMHATGSSQKPQPRPHSRRVLGTLWEFRLILSIFAIIMGAVLFGHILPLALKAFFFTLSNLTRKILLFLLPLLVFPYLIVSIATIKSKSAYLLVGIIVLIFASNFCSIMVAYGSGINFIPFLGLNEFVQNSTEKVLMPLIDFELQPWVEIEVTMLISIVLGLWLSYVKNASAIHFFEKYMNFSTFFFQKIYVPILPLYVLGTVLKLSYESDFSQLLPVFGSLMVMILLTQLSYIFLMFYVGASGQLQRTWNAIKHSFTAALVGFSTMSSLVTMPVTIKVAEQNIPDKNVARLAISSTVNCHDVGECISLPIIALSLFYLSYGHFPDVYTYTVFAFFVALAQFSGVSVPGGSIIIILPFLSKYLSFSPDMLSLIIAISIFMDPIGTANNVMGNSAFAMIIHRMYKGLSSKKWFRGSVDVS